MTPSDSIPPLKIGALAERTGTSAPTIRYYETIGLLPPPARQDGRQRRYGADDVRRLVLIRRCREFGFSIAQVRALVALTQDPQRDCREARELGQTQLDAVRTKLTELRALERELVEFVRQCDTNCAGGPGPACVPLTRLARGSREPSQAMSARSIAETRAGSERSRR